MKYGIIVCSKCKMAKGVILTNKTTRCNRCGRLIDLNKVSILFKTNNHIDLINHIGKINSQIYN